LSLPKYYHFRSNKAATEQLLLVEFWVNIFGCYYISLCVLLSLTPWRQVVNCQLDPLSTPGKTRRGILNDDVCIFHAYSWQRLCVYTKINLLIYAYREIYFGNKPIDILPKVSTDLSLLGEIQFSGKGTFQWQKRVFEIIPDSAVCQPVI